MVFLEIICLRVCPFYESFLTESFVLIIVSLIIHSFSIIFLLNGFLIGSASSGSLKAYFLIDSHSLNC